MARQGWGEFKNKGKNYDRDINYDKGKDNKGKNYDGDRNNDKGKNNFKGKTIIKVNTMTNAKTMTMQTSSMQIQKQRQKEAQQKKVIFLRKQLLFQKLCNPASNKTKLKRLFSIVSMFSIYYNALKLILFSGGGRKRLERRCPGSLDLYS